jgi:hypothetical protein
MNMQKSLDFYPMGIVLDDFRRLEASPIIEPQKCLQNPLDAYPSFVS